MINHCHYSIVLSDVQTFLLGAIASDDQIRITPSIRSQKGEEIFDGITINGRLRICLGWIWSKNTMTADNWLLEVKLRINGRGRIGADGMVSNEFRLISIFTCDEQIFNEVSIPNFLK